MRVEAQSNRPLFIGIARADNLDRYFSRIEHGELSSLTPHPSHVR